MEYATNRIRAVTYHMICNNTGINVYKKVCLEEHHVFAFTTVSQPQSCLTARATCRAPVTVW